MGYIRLDKASEPFGSKSSSLRVDRDNFAGIIRTILRSNDGFFVLEECDSTGESVGLAD